jgi:hypothetical protein
VLPEDGVVIGHPRKTDSLVEESGRLKGAGLP